ncbi:hypothetical protein EDD16DRAFT_1527634 [Pisolithus croceorrhizus]|nr:hypothetical protein EDD16DRAFT_1527634 [Pisolithus croceorrhizus]
MFSDAQIRSGDLRSFFDIEASGACRKVALTIRSEEGGPSCAKIVKGLYRQRPTVNLKGAGNGLNAGIEPTDMAKPTERGWGVRYCFPRCNCGSAMLSDMSPDSNWYSVKVVPPEPWLDNAKGNALHALCAICVALLRKSQGFASQIMRCSRNVYAYVVTAPFVSLKPLRLSKAGTFCSGNLWLLYCYAQDLSPNGRAWYGLALAAYLEFWRATFAKCAKTRSKIPTLLDPADRSSSGSATSYRFKYSEPLLLCIKPFLDSLHGGEEYLTVGMVVDMVPAELSGGWHTFEGHYPSEAWGGSGFTTGASAHLRGRTFRFFSFAAVKLVDSRITGNPMLHYSSSGNTPQDLIMYHAHSYSLRVVAVILRSLIVTAGYGGRNLAC